MNDLASRTMTRKRPRECSLNKLCEGDNAEDLDDERRSKKIRSQVGCDSETTESLSLEVLTPEVFCHVLGFLGPTSHSLISLSKLNKHFRQTMVAIGNSMLPRALIHFRKPLRPKSLIESSTSLFIRHARICAKILADLAYLRGLLVKDPATIQGVDVQNALNMTLDLLEVGPALSLPLEKQILSTCGKCGGKSFKHSKWVLAHHEGHHSSAESLEVCKKHQESLETSRLIMQTVVYRELQLYKELPSSINSFVQKKIGMKHSETTGCF